MILTIFRPESRHNVIFTTERCNSNCLMCSQPPKDVDDSWRFNEHLRLISLIDKDPPFLCITGGEANENMLDSKTRGQIALAVSQANGCRYCISSHTQFGARMLGLSRGEIERNRQGEASDEKAEAALQFAKAVMESQGRVSDEDVDAIRAAGYPNADIIDIITTCVTVLFTNFVNNVADTAIDFPVVNLEIADAG